MRRAVQQRRLNRSIIDGPETGQDDAELRKLGWNPRTAFEAVQRAALAERAQVARFNQYPRWRRGRIRDVIAAREMANELNEILSKALYERSVGLEEVAPDIEGRRRVFDVMPSFDVLVTLKTEYHRNPNHHWTANDICDIYALAGTLPYCDVVVTDKAIASHSTRTGLAKRLNTVVLVNLADLPEHL